MVREKGSRRETDGERERRRRRMCWGDGITEFHVQVLVESHLLYIKKGGGGR